MRPVPHLDLLLHPGSRVTSDEFPVLPLADLTTDGIRAACRTSTAPILGLGGMTGSINAAPVIQTSRVVDASEADIALLPLAGFEWLELLSDLPAAVLSRLPQVIQGSLIVLRRDHLMSGVSQSDPEEPANYVLARLADAGCRVTVRSTLPSTAAPLAAFRLPALNPDQLTLANTGLEQFLEFDPQRLAPVRSGEDVSALQSGLFQVHDALERSHTLAQTIEGRGRHRTGDYWHGIMHRREPDYANAKYWFRQVGAHPIHAELASRASLLLASTAHAEVAQWRSRLALAGRWDSPAFVDLCEQAAAAESGPLGEFARRIQWTEMLLLLDSTCQDAFGAVPAGA